MVDEEKRVYSLFCFLKKRAIQLLKEEKSSTRTEELLIDYLSDFGYLVKSEEKIIKQSSMWQLDLDEDSFEKKIDFCHRWRQRQEFQLDD
jgi:hypothetical protein